MGAAARVGDMHTCPMSEGGNAHAGGPVGVTPADGSPNVNIGSLRAARVGDGCTCAGSPDSIMSGSGSVYINGRPAARMNDPTLHGGKITQGCLPVNIGN